jgi:catechol 2,3-dioxygenase-like lactoylglutathione lyase family enzyme
MTTALRLDRIAVNVSDLDAAIAFHVEALGFAMEPAVGADPALAALLGARAVRAARLRRGRQTLELTQCDPPGAPYPDARRGNDALFQHCALVTDDIGAAHGRLTGHRVSPISRNGPQALPGGIVAFKFRDPDGHPLELIQFPAPDPATQGGIDHSAIVVASAGRSIAFYATRLGLRVTARQVNSGPAQDALDDLRGVTVDVVALAPPRAAPHVELLGYQSPLRRVSAPARPADIAATRLVLTVTALPGETPPVTLANGRRAELLSDPDGHLILLEQAPEADPRAGG